MSQIFCSFCNISIAFEGRFYRSCGGNNDMKEKKVLFYLRNKGGVCFLPKVWVWKAKLYQNEVLLQVFWKIRRLRPRFFSPTETLKLWESTNCTKCSENSKATRDESNVDDSFEGRIFFLRRLYITV